MLGARLIGAVLYFCLMSGQAVAGQGSPARGAYLYVVAGCSACHTDSKNNLPELSGGPPLVTPFGTFYAPNITPDPEHGIGGWSDEDFLRALRTGVGPEGQLYYPAFPYVSYSQADRQDLLDIKAYIFTLPKSSRGSRQHDLSFPFSVRSLMSVWRYLNFTPRRWMPDDKRSKSWNRGSYLVNALSHCGECHTPRNYLGALDRSHWLAGAFIGDGKSWAPNLTPHKTGLAGWSVSDIVTTLETGVTPGFNILGGAMREVVRHSTGKMRKDDLSAIAVYLKSLPPMEGARPPR